MGSKAIEVVQLSKHYGDLKAVDKISFFVKKQQIFTLLGPNGAGKTTTVEILEGLKRADHGTIYFFDRKCKEIGRTQKERIGVVLQKTNYLPRVKVKEMITLFGSFYKKCRPSEAILERIALTDKANALVENLSGGQRQRLAIGLALVNDPDIVFLDEPTTGLDPQARRNIWGLIEELKADGKTIFLTTHYMDEAEKLSDYVYIMDQGRIIAGGTPLDLIGQVNQDNVLEFTCGNLTKAKLAKLTQSVDKVTVNNEQLSVYAVDIIDVFSLVINWAEENEVELENLSVRRPNLEDVFLQLTGKGLRD